MTTKSKFFSVLLVILLVGGGAFFFFKFYFVFGDGVKAGELNYMVHKGYVFKTYEGKLIQAGFDGKAKSTNGIQSYEFQFSVDNKAIADSLMNCSGQQVKLHYKEYLGALPWRGVSKFVVDSIVSVEPIKAFDGIVY